MVGVGIGVEPPVVAAGIGDEPVLDPIDGARRECRLAETGVGAGYERRLVVVDDVPRLIGKGRGAPAHEGRAHP